MSSLTSNRDRTPKEVLVKLLFFLALTFMGLYMGFAIFSASKDTYWDFPNYYTSSRLLAEGESVARFYDNAWFASRGHDFGFERVARFTPFPPATATLMLPFSGLTPIAAKRAWVIVNVLLLFYAIFLVRQICKFDWFLSAFLVLLLGASLALNFRLGQFYLVILVILLLTYQTYLRHKWGISAALLAVVTLVKYFPVIFISGFLNKRFLLYFSISMTLLVVVQWLYFGTDTLMAYLSILQEHLNGNIEGQGQHVIAFQSFDSLFANLFIEDPIANPNAIIDWPTGKSVGKAIVLFLAAASALWTIRKVKSEDKAVKRDLILVISGMAAFTVLPASAAYHFILLFFPFILFFRIAYRQLSPQQRGLLILLFALVANSAYLNVPFSSGIAWLDLLLSYPRLWTMTLLYAYTLKIVHTTGFGNCSFQNTGLTYHEFTKITPAA